MNRKMLTTKNEFRFQFMLPTKGLVIGFIADVKVLEDLFRMRGGSASSTRRHPIRLLLGCAGSLSGRKDNGRQA